MLRTLSTAISGLRSHQVMMDVLSNDIANVNTVGYKAQRTTFKDVLFQSAKPPSDAGGGFGTINGQQIGLGVQLGGVENQMSQGALQNTGNPLDLAIQGEGFFRISADPAFANIELTRAGNLQLDGQGRLVTPDGFFLVGYTIDPGTGNPTTTETIITLPANIKSVTVDQLGKVRVVDGAGNPADIAYLSVAKFSNPQGLERTSGNRWKETIASGGPLNTIPGDQGVGTLASGALEMSNVDLSQEFSAMILAQRGLQANSRAITTADEILQTLVQMKR